MKLFREIASPIRACLTWEERWAASDKGLIWCWERGRLMAEREVPIAQRASSGELIQLAWKRGSLQYLAQWQGLRSESLNINDEEPLKLACAKTGKPYLFRSGAIDEVE